MSQHIKTILLVETARRILAEYHPMTLRQVYYQLVSGQVIKNNRSQYQAVSNALVDARQDGTIPWDWIEDRLRRPHTVGMWDDLADFSKTALAAYRRDVWKTQPAYLEVWLEKDALSGIFEDVIRPYGVTLQVARGYDGWDSIYRAAKRYGNGDSVTILYFGDLDPSGEDMPRSLRERLGELGCFPEIVTCALKITDVEAYHLPPAPVKTDAYNQKATGGKKKKGDTRAPAFIAKYGFGCWELDALPKDVLEKRLKNDIETRLDLAALELVKQAEQGDKERLKILLGGEA